MNILIKSGWMGRNKSSWYEGPDDLGLHILKLAKNLNSLGHKVVFSGDLTEEFNPDVEIHLDVQFSLIRESKKILVISEPDFVQPQNLLTFSYYKVVFDWAVNSKFKNSINYLWPRSIVPNNDNKWNDRTILISCVAANKNAVFNTKRNLYPERLKYIKYFNDKLPNEFYLYGAGWDMKDHPVGILGKYIFKKFTRSLILKRKLPLDSYKGKCSSKFDVLKYSKFALCIENQAQEGGLTEKISDCIASGVIPLYLGATNIEELIPSNLYIDLRKFKNMDSVLEMMLAYTEDEYQEWILARDLEINALAEKYSIDRFVNLISKEIIKL